MTKTSVEPPKCIFRLSKKTIKFLFLKYLFIFSNLTASSPCKQGSADNIIIIQSSLFTHHRGALMSNSINIDHENSPLAPPKLPDNDPPPNSAHLPPPATL